MDIVLQTGVVQDQVDGGTVRIMMASKIKQEGLKIGVDVCFDTSG